MNSLTITGNLGKDAELRALPDGTSICSCSVADNQGKDKPSIWWNCALWGKRADSLCQYLTKGQQVTVIGTVTEREYVDKDGNKRKSMDVRVNDIALQGGKRDSQGDGSHPPQKTQPAPVSHAARPSSVGSGFDNFDDVPF